MAKVVIANVFFIGQMKGEKVELKASGLMKNWVKENKYPMYGKQPCPMSSSETIICMLTKSSVTGSMTSFIF
ncbi:hypothetical protein NXW18_04765 [Bacteroides thetaiotaomicron]|uniref:hypothetical protein n=1 Tax=Bacteroides thetaiotaomicron TaxID=818 RepID=UPI0021655057|nr:hypothetical protein [Bacteroides thetaiotaomicron]MCS2873054.1 hypothetical protein [Bacteroides thetaiotaomicron]